MEFNSEKSINIKARAAATLKLVVDEYGYLPSFHKEGFIQYHKEHISESKRAWQRQGKIPGQE